MCEGQRGSGSSSDEQTSETCPETTPLGVFVSFQLFLPSCVLLKEKQGTK